LTPSGANLFVCPNLAVTPLFAQIYEGGYPVNN
jgi:hypothetical protein